jgi:uncharacterized protein YkwD
MTRHAIWAFLCLFITACGGPVSSPSSHHITGFTTSGDSASAQVNAIRAGANRPALKRSNALDAAARSHANDMASRNFFSHKGSNGATVGKRATSAGYRWCMVSENIAEGYRDQATVIEGWRNSPGHYTNIVSPKAKEYGLANVGDVWVMVLGAKKC